MGNYKRNILSYLAFRFFLDFALIYPVYVIFFQQRGIDFIGIAQLIAIWAGAMMVLEIPSGIIADLWSRKKIIALSLILKAIGFIIWFLLPSFAGFAIGFIFWGFQEALCSGTTDALLYDFLKTQGREQEYEIQAGRGTLVSRIAIICSLLLGGWVFSRSPGITILLSSLSMVFSGLCILFITEAGHKAQGMDKECVRKPGFYRALKDISESVKDAFRQRGMAVFILFGAFTCVIYGILDEYDFIFGKHNGVPLAWIGVWGAFRFLMEGIGGLLAPKISVKIGTGNIRGLALWTAAAGLFLSLGTLWGLRFLLPLYFVFYGMMAAAEVIFQGILQRSIESAGRATISSLVSFLYTALGIGAGIILGLAADKIGLPSLFYIGGASVFLSALAYYFYKIPPPGCGDKR